MKRLLLLFNFLVVCFFEAQALSRACGFKPADLVFVLDGSGSEGHAHFNKELEFVANVTKHFHIGQDKTRVSLVTFGNGIKNEFYLDNNFTKTELLTHISNAGYPNGETNTHKAIHFINAHTLNASHGGGRNVSKLVIVLTDGKSSNPTALTRAIGILKSHPYVTTIAIGIGNKVDNNELSMIASDSNHTFHVRTFDALSTLQDYVTRTACHACIKSLSDVCFVLDGSGSEGAINFHKQLQFVNTVINQLSFGSGSKTRVCLVTYASGAHLEIRLRNGMTKEELMNNVLKVPWSNGDTMTNKGLAVAHAQLNNNVHANKLAIVLTDGQSNDPDLTRKAANALHKDGIETFAVGIGRRVDNDELNNIASDSSHVFTVGTFDQLKDIRQNVVNRICSHGRHTNGMTTIEHHRHHTTASRHHHTTARRHLHTTASRHHHTTASRHHTTASRHHTTASRHHTTASRHHTTVSRHHTTARRHLHTTASRHHHTTASRHHTTASRHHTTVSRHHTTASRNHHTTAKPSTRVQTTRTSTSAPTITFRTETASATPAGCHKKPADIVFVIDSSETQGVDNFNAAVDFAHDFAANISKVNADVKFSSVTFSSSTRNDFFLNKFNSGRDALNALSNVQYIGLGSKISDALKFVRTQSLQPNNGARINSNKIVVIITNGYSDESQTILTEAQLLQKEAKVFAVSIGPPLDRSQADLLASSHHAVKASNGETLLQSIETELVDPSCTSNLIG